MISLFYKTESETGFKDFPNNRKGNSDCLKFIQALYDLRKQHPWYHNFFKIKNVEAKLEDRRLRSKKKYQLESELKSLQNERTEVLQKWGGEFKEPEKIIIEIRHN